MNPRNVVRKEGLILETLPGATFRVRFENDELCLAHLSGKMRVHRIRLVPGDRVIVELASENDRRGRIVYRK
ncbi:MAG: translation initiation factor IF-1 [Candidatus Terrybacteria bacterium]|uniref:Translation initiation factor IF-1 n=2 Tax=Candidatus Terryibacteriota TaxID=1817920 RepID=A0A1G2PX60_9BACT|nr:translation initiation factor IF-1 [Candidatus Terrybacteria bacterium]OHA48381.1 MAG: translation initiation factor IF-1 [Candidatus Terrybacteria bacterium RIFCSPHIGHO2_01_FULL_58_15]OHA52359.1 MAG: translation initiation factor IF-1 [Candidatus Terrybacteria bacterium RIFCSPLOWO2_01_FULL_58_14]